MSGLIGNAPNQAPSNGDLGELARMNKDNVVLKPAANASPLGLGEMVFYYVDDTTIGVKLKGLDGTVRSGTITLT